MPPAGWETLGEFTRKRFGVPGQQKTPTSETTKTFRRNCDLCWQAFSIWIPAGSFRRLVASKNSEWTSTYPETRLKIIADILGSRSPVTTDLDQPG